MALQARQFLEYAVKWNESANPAGGGFVLKRYIPDYLLLFGFSGTLIVLDQWTKLLVRSRLAFQEFWAPWDWLLPYARIVHWHNTGAAFGMLPGFGDVFTVLAFFVSLAILYYFPKVPRQDYVLRLAMGLQLSGAVGNLIDRLTIGHVTDFISLGTFPVFNIADASISTGVVVLIFGVWFRERQQARAGSPTAASHTVNQAAPVPAFPVGASLEAGEHLQALDPACPLPDEIPEESPAD
jgi:signal peptidase II